MRPDPNSIVELAPRTEEIIPEEQDYTAFKSDLEQLINRHSLENGSNTPDWILAEYLVTCLKAFNETSRAREKWYGKSLNII